jgi:hypothetical protein
MTTRLLAGGVAAAALTFVMSASTSVAGQSASPAAKPAAKPWTAPKTSWGDPDLQGVWTSDAALGIPLQRPAQYGNRAELDDKEFAEKQQRDERTRVAAENAEGSFRGDGAWLTRSFRQTSLIIDPPNGQIPPLTPEAEKRRAGRDQGTFGEGPFDSTEDFTNYDRCITRGVVGSVLPVIYGNGNRIVQAPGYVAISYEMIHDTRIIPVDGRPHIGPNIRQYLGDSRGHWEGNTLVIETTNLTDRTSIGLNGNGLRHSAAMKMTERITRGEPDVLRYEVTLDDPKTYTQPWTISLPLSSPKGYMLLPYECHEGNRAVMQTLGAERAEDIAIAEDAKKGTIRPRRSVQQNLDARGAPRPGSE